MNRDIVAGNWKQLRGRLKTQWGDFTGNQIDVTTGKRLLWAGKIQEDCGVSNEQAEQQLKHFAKCHKDYRY